MPLRTPSFVIENEAQRALVFSIACMPRDSDHWLLGSRVHLITPSNIEAFLALRGDTSYVRPAYAGEAPEPLPLPG